MMRIFKQNKLWREKAPAMMEKHGSVMHVRSLTDEEFDRELRLKLIEEADEAKQAFSAEKLKEELADLYEVIDALMLLHNIQEDYVLAVQCKKREERGRFSKHTYVTVAEHPIGSFGEKYRLADPEKYPEVI